MLEAGLFALLSETADAAFAVDEQGLVRSWNPAAEKLFGHSSSEVIDKPCADLLEGRGHLGTPVCIHGCSVIECAAAHREIPNFDLEVKTSAGQRVWVNISILVFRDARTSRRLVVHLARDITQRKKNEELTRRALQFAKQLASLPNEPGCPAPVSPLTERERRVLRLLSEGKPPAEAARLLGITPRTLRNHVHHANRKLGTRSRLEAVIHAVRRGLI